MKWLLGILLTLSLGANTYFVWREIKYRENVEWGKRMDKAFGGKVENIPWSKGLPMFNDSLKKHYPKLKTKKYFYINIWAMFCHPCIKEMPLLDSLAGTIERKDVAYIFLSDNSYKGTKDLLVRKKFNIKNFVYLDNMDDFISSVYNEQKKKSKVFPTIVILDNKGKIVHYETGAYENVKEAKEFADLIEKLK
ncbi:MAG TPA: TlpA disulfide reductase family protein [Bacteroidia bacterium]|jgi:thiol-disulfide isomerase/thioredoxin|nr:TlpA disulfide reductase family protein [Bacteroidia bacterium]